jgi:hypothetical protein
MSIPDHHIECEPWPLTFLDDLPQEDDTDGEDTASD